jgi:LPXTG-site transpeptidase (sortase) family protein
VIRHLLATLAAAALLTGGVLLNLPSDVPAAAPAPVGAAAEPSPRPTPTAERELTDGSIGVPDQIEIESLEIDAPVQSVGTTPENAQEVPSALDETGWWRDGSEPGAGGNAVIVGHTASSDDGVFDPLVDVEEGAEVFVTGDEGTAAFTVDRIEVVPVAQFGDVAPDVYRTDGDAGLVLMTCGDWNGEEFETTVIVHASVA